MTVRKQSNPPFLCFHQPFLMVTTSSNIDANVSTTFGEDFIPFVVEDPSDDKPGPSKRRRTDEGERETDENVNRDDTTGRLQTSERQAASNGDLNEVPTSDRVKEKSRMPASEREWDRGKEPVADDKYDRRNGHDRNRKRKYEENDDGYSNRRQRVEVGSRKCPWVADLDLNRCTNVAEM